MHPPSCSFHASPSPWLLNLKCAHRSPWDLVKMESAFLTSSRWCVCCRSRPSSKGCPLAFRLWFPLVSKRGAGRAAVERCPEELNEEGGLDGFASSLVTNGQRYASGWWGPKPSDKPFWVSGHMSVILSSSKQARTTHRGGNCCIGSPTFLSEAMN